MSTITDLIDDYLHYRTMPQKKHIRQHRADQAMKEFETLIGERDNALTKVDELTKDLEKYKSKADVTACAYCGHETPKADAMGVINHIMTCDKRPEKKLLEKAFEIEDGLFQMIAHLTQSAYSPDHCDTCAGIQERMELWKLVEKPGKNEQSDVKSSVPLKIPVHPRIRFVNNGDVSIRIRRDDHTHDDLVILDMRLEDKGFGWFIDQVLMEDEYQTDPRCFPTLKEAVNDAIDYIKVGNSIEREHSIPLIQAFLDENKNL